VQVSAAKNATEQDLSVKHYQKSGLNAPALRDGDEKPPAKAAEMRIYDPMHEGEINPGDDESD
jgi:hypothetical protein